MKVTGRAGAVAAALTAAALGVGVLASGASAHQLRPYQYQGHFDGHDATGGAFTSNLRSLTIDQSNGRIYALDQHGSEGEVSQFDSEGHAVLFPALNGSSTLHLGGGYAYNDLVGAIQFDWTPFNGGLYTAGAGDVKAYHADGSLRWGPAGSGGATDIAPVVPDGSVLYTPSVNTTSTLHEASNGANGSGEYFYEGYFTKLETGNDGFYYYTRTDSERGVYKGQNLKNCAGLHYPEIIACQRVLQVTYTTPRDLAVDRSAENFYVVEPPYDHVTEYTTQGQPVESFGLPEGAFAGLSEARGIAVNEATKDVYVTSLDGSPRVDVFHQGSPVTVPDVSNLNPIHPNTTSATLRGVVNADGVTTTGCKFEWGPTSQYTNTIATEGTPCEQGEAFSGSGDHEVTLHVGSLSKGSTYHYRIASRNANGYWSYSPDRKFEGSVAPTSPAVLVDRVNTDGARFTSVITPNGGVTAYHFEVGTQDCASNPCQSVPVPNGKLSSNLNAESVAATIQGLEPDTTYFVRLVAENDAGAATPSSEFHTFASPPSSDPCPNAQVRQQTSAYLLPDCRAYELASAANAGGYDVESSLIPGQTPFAAYPGRPGPCSLRPPLRLDSGHRRQPTELRRRSLCRRTDQ